MIRIIATTLSIFSLMAYALSVSAASPARPAENFIGAEVCKGCHLKEYQQWQNSDHDWAMREASEQSVLGNFNNQVFEHFGSKSSVPVTLTLTSKRPPCLPVRRAHGRRELLAPAQEQTTF